MLIRTISVACISLLVLVCACEHKPSPSATEPTEQATASGPTGGAEQSTASGPTGGVQYAPPTEPTWSTVAQQPPPVGPAGGDVGPVTIPGNTHILSAGTLDPQCRNGYLNCSTVTFNQVPLSAHNIRVIPSASRDGQTWVDCTTAATSTDVAYAYMDCGAVAVRFLGAVPQITPDFAAGVIAISWKVQNLAQGEQYAGLIVGYDDLGSRSENTRVQVGTGDSNPVTQSKVGPSEQSTGASPKQPDQGWRHVADPQNISQGNSVSYKVENGWVMLRNDSSTKAYFRIHWQCNGWNLGRGAHLKPGEAAKLEYIRCDTDSLQKVWVEYFVPEQ